MDVLNHPAKRSAQRIYGDEPTTLDELGNALIVMIDNFQGIGTIGNQEAKKHTGPVCAGLYWDIRFSDRVPNTHSAPLNGRTNWGYHNPDAPRGYPGFQGRIWVRFATKLHTFGSDPLRGTLVHTGTGGFGAYDGPWQEVYRQYRRRAEKVNLKSVRFLEPIIYSWDVKIFLDDWPEIQRWVEKSQTFNALKGNDTSIKHQFSWDADWAREFDSTYLLGPDYENGFTKDLVKSFA